ncbi:hypothetical protein INS49_003892 [Diaporthe citri]|uniref:uncharacterized protein n=1 Tax=Diaporthe citri TaxID=83186 RepID=UPI001C8024FB|nr:uncharacterized protein INS49_003892 [Diaporthe citri]KAG6354811.1 hypothetical protein INS49_003892 [Diaporthe citri]
MKSESSAEHVRDAGGGGCSDSNPKHQNWFHKTLKPKKINARYPIKGSPLLFATCGFGSLGDALFGYNSDYGGADGSTDGVNPTITGISVACLQPTAALGALVAGWLGDIIGRKKCVRLGGLIYFFRAFIQIFAPDFATFIAGRTIQGLGVGFLSMAVPIIQTEIAAPHARGHMVGIEYTFLIAGYMLYCWVDNGFNFLLPDKLSWQGPFITQIVLSFILVAMSFFLPETPHSCGSPLERLHLVIAGFCLFSAGLSYFYYVETACHTPEEIAVAFGDKAFEGDDGEVMATARQGSLARARNGSTVADGKTEKEKAAEED